MSLYVTDISLVNLANNETAEISGFGTVSIKAEVNSTLQNIPVYDTLLVPQLKTNLLSVSKLCDKGYTVTFKETCALIKNFNNVYLIANHKDDKKINFRI